MSNRKIRSLIVSQFLALSFLITSGIVNNAHSLTISASPATLDIPRQDFYMLGALFEAMGVSHIHNDPPPQESSGKLSAQLQDEPVLSPASASDILTFQWNKPGQFTLCAQQPVQLDEILPFSSPPKINISVTYQTTNQTESHCKTLTTRDDQGITTLRITPAVPLDINKSTLALLPPVTDTTTPPMVSVCLNSKLLSITDYENDSPPGSVWCADWGETSDDTMNTSLDRFIQTTRDTYLDQNNSEQQQSLESLLHEIEWELELENKRLWWSNHYQLDILEESVQPTASSGPSLSELAGLYGGYNTGHSLQWHSRILNLGPTIRIDPRPSPKRGPSTEHILEEEDLEIISGILSTPFGVKPKGSSQNKLPATQQPPNAMPNASDRSLSVEQARKNTHASGIQQKLDHMILEAANFPWHLLAKYLVSNTLDVITPLSFRRFSEITKDPDSRTVLKNLKQNTNPHDTPEATFYLASALYQAYSEWKTTIEENLSSSARRLKEALRSAERDFPRVKLSEIETPDEGTLIGYCHDISKSGFFDQILLRAEFNNTPSVLNQAIQGRSFIDEASQQTFQQPTATLSDLRYWFPQSFLSGVLLYALLEGSYVGEMDTHENPLEEAIQRRMREHWPFLNSDLQEEMAILAIQLAQFDLLRGTGSAQPPSQPAAIAQSQGQTNPESSSELPLTIMTLKRLPIPGGSTNVIEEIGTHYYDLGIYLLRDDNGMATRAIINEQRRNSENINTEILSRWLQGGGRGAPSWSNLIEALRNMELNRLADQITQAVSNHKNSWRYEPWAQAPIATRDLYKIQEHDDDPKPIHLIEELAIKHRDLGISLGLTDAAARNAASGYHSNLEDTLVAVIGRAIQRDAKLTWEKFVKALFNMGMNNLAVSVIAKKRAQAARKAGYGWR